MRGFSRWILLPYRFSTSPVFKSLLALSPSFLHLPPLPPSLLRFVILPGGAGVKGRGPMKKHLIPRAACHEGIRPLTPSILAHNDKWTRNFPPDLAATKATSPLGLSRGVQSVSLPPVPSGYGARQPALSTGNKRRTTPVIY